MDEDTYINIDDVIRENIIDLYQTQLFKEYVIIKHVGTCTTVPDMIISENFGTKKNLNLYSIVNNKNELNVNIYIPVIKIVDDLNNIYTLSVRFEKEVEFDKKIYDYELYLTVLVNNVLNCKIIEKTVDKDNIIEMLFEKLIDSGVNIL